ncbi:nuclear transport factor 2 family protein [Nocardia sp. alder85J]|uniref:nuclear transport factor 2 family protein n=1 Tax=Nocardia sp. alder85J TaxID=2862949 RepID=UPI001CD4308D|nr:nuclear transport factor 2 family protein [Nocardia sp. alder85J]MCX4098876.1 nuclear transport factor 2 family protein [Nocardia sp. alder85J]
MTDISAEDRIAIHEVIALHGHLADDHDGEHLGDLFTEDVVMDVGDFGLGTVRGLAAMRELWSATVDDAGQPLGHHVTNIVVVGREGASVRTRSKGLAVGAGGTAGSCVYEDVLRREPQGWRIEYRKVVARRRAQ